MNCVKCPIYEECEVSGKMQSVVEYSVAGAGSIPIKAEPYNKDDCPLLRVIKEREAV